jgi:peptidoglycan hydrolase-like protein with peptidoglycan-binding domain
MSYAPPRRRAHTSQRATGRFGAFFNTSALALALALVIPSAAAAVDPPTSAGWHGRPIQDPQPPGDAVTTADSFPSGWSAGPVRMGTGFRHDGGSERVREVQKRLWKLGYRPGPVDGLFGPRTQAAVQWFQVKHGFRPTGVVEVRTLTLLRERTGAAPGVGATPAPVRGVRPGAPGTAPQPRPAAQPADRGTPVAPIGLLALALLAAPAALALTAVRRRRTGTPKPRRAAAERKVAVVPAPHAAVPAPHAAVPAPQAPAAPSPGRPTAPSPGRPTAIGYVRAGAGDRAELARHAGAIRRACTRRGWQLAELVCDDQTGAGRAFDRPGLAAAMERLSEPGPSRLVVSKLAHLSRSAADLTALFEWFSQNEVQVIATDVGIDTTTPEGKRAAESVLTKVVKRQAHARTNGRNGAHTHNGVHEKAKVELTTGAGHGDADDSGGPG